MTLDIPSQAARTLMEIGFMAAGCGLHEQARTIFDGLEAVRPTSEGPPIGRALIHLGRKEHDVAVGILRDVVAGHPASLEAKMMLGIALKVAGRNAECSSVVRDLEASGDAKAKSVAAALLAQ
jgi:hypothetical protein